MMMMMMMMMMSLGRLLVQKQFQFCCHPSWVESSQEPHSLAGRSMQRFSSCSFWAYRLPLLQFKAHYCQGWIQKIQKEGAETPPTPPPPLPPPVKGTFMGASK